MLQKASEKGPEKRMRRADCRSQCTRTALVAALAAGSLVLSEKTTRAQQQTFHLDRLEIPGAPQDGLVLFRPVTDPSPIVYAQLALGLSIDPLRTSDITNVPTVLQSSPTNLVAYQISTYVSAGFELLDRLTLGGTFPAAWIQGGNQPVYTAAVFGPNPSTTSFSTTGPAVGDTRLDARYVVWRSLDRDWAFGAQLSAFIPTGTTTNFGSDGAVAWLPMVTGEWTPPNLALPLTFVANTGIDFRHDNSINNPGTAGTQGLGIGNEWRWALGAQMPLKNGRFRVGLTFFGQTGLSNDNITGNTIFTAQNTPIEWNAEGRMQWPLAGLEHLFVGAGVGTRMTGGYGAPDFRMLAVAGTYWSLPNSASRSPQRPARMRISESDRDTDGDGIPDDIDACPTIPEDHKEPDPNDGCPAPTDRDHDGIPDDVDKCPDLPEDKDGIEDADGCPETDTDGDGIPDFKDACPKEPGTPDPDPQKNGCPKYVRLEGSTVHVLQQVHFETASATILPDSFPMLMEVVKLLQASPNIKHMTIEGHTDNRGGAAYNLQLSKQRAMSVRNWLVEHGVANDRLQSEGYGLTRPVATNETDEGRAANRRVEFKIIEQEPHGGQQRAP
jgi:outer membrane protein OmpA-like peptidoglycan-associated protein